MRITDAPFSSKEVWLIRRMLETPVAVLLCPRCSSPLSDEESIVPHGAVVLRCRLIRCVGCRRMLVMNN